jgi:hypothetical protein
MNLTLVLLIAAELLCLGGGVVSVAYRHRLDDWYPRAPAVFGLLLLVVTIGLRRHPDRRAAGPVVRG